MRICWICDERDDRHTTGELLTFIKCVTGEEEGRSVAMSGWLFRTTGATALLAVFLALGVTDADASITCRVWAAEDTSAAGQRRERIFVSTNAQEADHAVTIGYLLASRRASTRRLDFLDVLVTRDADGTNRAQHSLNSSIAHIRFNPGRTPITPTRLSGNKMASLEGLVFSNGMLTLRNGNFPDFPSLNEQEITEIARANANLDSVRCRGE